MRRYFIKINNKEYLMVDEPVETDKEMADNSYVKVTGAQFDKTFNLYEQVLKKEITYKDALKEIRDTDIK